MLKFMLVAFLMLLGGGAVYMYTSGEVSQEPDEALSFGAVHVTVLENDVFVSQRGSPTAVKVEGSISTDLGATIRTSRTGRAFIEMPDKSLTLDFDSQITIPTENTKDVSTVILLAGSVWARVEKVFEKGEYFEVKTQDTVAAVRGTEFTVSYKDKTTTVLVKESKVAVSPLSEVAGKPETAEEVLVSAGEKAVKKGKAKTVVAKQTETDQKDPWYEFNATLDVESLKETLRKKNFPEPREATPKSTVSSEEKVKTPVAQPEPPPKPVVCPQDTKQCPDGSFVGRIAPSCQFAICPEAKTESASSPPTLPPGKIELKELAPKSAATRSTETFTVKGQGFSHAVGVFLTKKGSEKTHKPSFKVVDDATITFTLPTDSDIGLYNVVVASDTEEGASLNDALIVSE